MSRRIALLRAASRLDAARIVWWLSDGAALGAWRDGRLIESDGDIDLGVWADDIGRARDAVGGTVRRDMPGQVQLRFAQAKFDIHGHSVDGDTVWFPLGRHEQYRYVFDRRLFRKFDRRRMYGRMFRLPSPTVDYLTAHYGPGWATPTSQWRWNVDPPCLVKR